jgi:inward rectifier potassium channel
MVNRDGSFNLRREGESLFDAWSPYHELLVSSWPHFLSMVVLAYFVIHLLFAGLFFALGPGALNGAGVGSAQRFSDCYFFSVQTFAGIGYGRLNPATFPADVLVTLESIVGLLGLALATGLIFARFSRPTARILWSRTAVVAPYRDTTGLMFRIANARRSQIIEVQAMVILSTVGPDGRRAYRELDLERSSITFFPLSWTIVHPINDLSPLHGITSEDLIQGRAELLIRIHGIDERTSQTVHARSSYTANEIEWNARFRSIFLPTEEGVPVIDLRRLGDTTVPD